MLDPELVEYVNIYEKTTLQNMDEGSTGGKKVQYKTGQYPDILIYTVLWNRYRIYYF